MNSQTVDITENQNKEQCELKKSRDSHRRNEPSYNKPAHRIPFIQRLRAAWDAHDINRNPHIIKLRREGGKICTLTHPDGSKRYRILEPRRLTMREERQQTITELVKAIINHVDYSTNSEYPLECRLSLEKLAEQINQLHRYERGYSEQYPNGRVSYDPVHGALDDLRASGLMFAVTGYDKNAAKFKATRIFLTPLFFQSLNFSGAEVAKLFKDHKRWLRNNPQKKYEPTPISSRMAEISTTALLSILDYHKRWFNGEFEPDAIEARKKQEAKEINRTQRERDTGTESKLTQIYRQYLKLKAELKVQPILCIAKEKELNAIYPNQCIEYYESLIAWLTNSIH